MTLRARAKAVAPKQGRPSSFGAWRDSLTPKQRRDLDGTLADRTLSDASIAVAIEDEYDRRFAAATVGYWRKSNRLR